MGEMADLARDEALRVALEGDEWNDPMPDGLVLKLFMMLDYFRPTRKLRADEWCTADRVVMRISKMKTSHVLNALNYIKRRDAYAKMDPRRMNNLEREGRKRGLVCDSQGWWHESVF